MLPNQLSKFFQVDARTPDITQKSGKKMISVLCHLAQLFRTNVWGEKLILFQYTLYCRQ